MATPWCLIKDKAETLLSKIKSGELGYAKLRKMESEARFDLFKKELGVSDADAKRMNVLFEKKLLQRDFFKGMDAWASKVSGVPSNRIEAIRKNISKHKADNLTKIFNPKDGKMFLSELAEQKVGVGLTREEAQVIFKLSKEVNVGESAFNKKYIRGVIETARGSKINTEDAKLLDSILSKLEEAEITGRTRKFLASNAWRDLRRAMTDGIPDDARTLVNEQIERVLKERVGSNYGASRAELEEIIGKLKIEADGTYSGEFELLKKNKGVNEVVSLTKRGIVDAFSLIKALKGSFDVSAIGRQGLPVLTSGHPKEWLELISNQAKILKKSYDMRKDGIGDKVLTAIRSDINNRPLGRLGIYDRMKVAIGGREEQFASTIADKIPLIKESSEMFTGSLWIARADLADKLYLQMVKDWKSLGIDILSSENVKLLDEELFRIGRRINSMTGRGDLWIGKAGGVTNAALWSPKFLQSNMDKLSGHILDSDMMKSPVQRKRLFREWATRITTTAAAMTVGSMLLKDENSVEYDPSSSKFGTVKGIDVTGGMGGYITLFTRLFGVPFGMEIKNTSTGIKSKASNYKNGVTSILSDFVEGKTSPGSRFIIDYLEGYNFDGQSTRWDKENPERTIGIWAKGIFSPIPIENYVEAYNASQPDNLGDALKLFNVAMLADIGGFSNKNGVYVMSWEQSQSKEMLQFKEKVGTKKFLEANKEYASEMKKNIPIIVKNVRFNELDDKQKKSRIDSLNKRTKEKIFEKYGFEYEPDTQDASDEMELSIEEVDKSISELLGE